MAVSIAATLSAFALFAVSCGGNSAPPGDEVSSASVSVEAPPIPTVVVDATSTTVRVPDPVGVRIPTIAVDAEIGPLGLRPDGTIDVPSDFAKTGWWVDGPEPGDLGSAVILGHVDSRSGPAVFYEVPDLVAGDSILVDRADGSVATFVVDRVEQHPKDDFPTQDVYGATPDAQLRLVTCGGEFDRTERSYEDNIIVFARLVGIAPSA